MRSSLTRRSSSSRRSSTSSSTRSSLSRSSSLYLAESAFVTSAVAAVSTTPHHTPHTDLLNDNDEMVKVARNFLTDSCPEFLSVLDNHPDTISSLDRLVKVGRNVTSILHYAAQKGSKVWSKTKTDDALAVLLDECDALTSILSSNNKDDEKHNNENDHHKVPTVRFGKTELQMPILTLGCMRFQQSWNRGNAPMITKVDQIETDCQTNLLNILRYGISMGITHIETAKGYGSSEIQLGAALKVMFDNGEVKREDLILQTKGGISSSMTPQQLRTQVEHQLRDLQVDYVDLYSLHGCNTEEHYTWLFNRGDEDSNLWPVLQQLKVEGKIRHIGFSTHAPTHVITKLINTNKFEYVNLHYHFLGSYTASGDGQYGGNLENIRLLNQKDMGVFIISPFDKGGRLYAPSHQLRALTLPDMEPISYGATWLWQHHQFDTDKAQCHTIVCGAARPSDLDQPLVSSLQLSDPDTAIRRMDISQRLDAHMKHTLGKEWVHEWHVGLPNSSTSKRGTQHGNIVWLYNLIKSFGLLDFAKERYVSLMNRPWDEKLSHTENVSKCGPVWPWVPGRAIEDGVDYEEDFKDCPEGNRKKLEEAVRFVHEVCVPRKSKEKVTEEAEEDGKEEKENKEKTDSAAAATTIPLEWETSYDMRPWTAFPERS